MPVVRRGWLSDHDRVSAGRLAAVGCPLALLGNAWSLRLRAVGAVVVGLAGGWRGQGGEAAPPGGVVRQARHYVVPGVGAQGCFDA